MAETPVLRIVTPEEVPMLELDPVDPTALIQAKEIVDDVRKTGEAGLRKHALRLGDIPDATSKYVLDKAEMKAAFDSLPEDEQALLLRTRDRIQAFAQCQLDSVQSMETSIPGGRAGHTLSPMAVAGCYAPGGRYPLPSSVLMTAVTARTAGVKTVVVASPRPAPVTVAAAHVAGADLLLCIGGAQGIAALAFGTPCVPACDIIVGPGNKWVTAAKSLVQGRCAIDMLAGPSEVLAIADGSADADVLAADMLAQAEHDTDARPILVTPDAALAHRVNARIAARLAELPTRDTAAEACKKGFIVVCPDMDSAIAVSDSIAPEHLEIQTENAQEVADKCLDYGGLFIGSRAAEVLGDYGAGPNHVLPTGGTGKYTGGLSVFNFVRIRTWMRIDAVGDAQQVVKDSVQLARLEGLEGHARSAECRLLQ
ncbi:histidinol dehydrogenase [Tribonema minus]|uniref:Histidinol dehydrogenase n=1 Tax=Tribonema minus TaxID=303371 RepID=A0A835YMH6_9STRA|nr:histidinol dehydrogenase [Tribonema minus]